MKTFNPMSILKPTDKEKDKIKEIYDEFRILAEYLEKLEKNQAYQEIFGEGGYIEKLIERRKKQLNNYVENNRKIDKEKLDNIKWNYEKAKAVMEVIEAIKDSKEKAKKEFLAAKKGEFYVYK